MRRLLAIVIALFVVLQYGAAAARAASPCCTEGCTDPVMCVMVACKPCAAQAVIPQAVPVVAAVSTQVMDAEPIDAALPTATTDIWRPPR